MMRPRICQCSAPTCRFTSWNCWVLIRYSALGSIKEMVQAGRFAFADSKGKAPAVGAFESWIKSLRRQHPNRKMVGIGDNFHLYQDFAHTEGESRLRRISQAAKLLTTTYDMTLICPMEVPGTHLARGRRPDIKAIKGSTGPQYDSNLNMAVYNDLIDMQENALFFWDDEAHCEEKLTPAGETVQTPRRKPIVELVIDKNKVNGVLGKLYFRFWPETGLIEECNLQEQAAYTRAAETGQQPALQHNYPRDFRRQDAPPRNGAGGVTNRFGPQAAEGFLAP